MSHGHEPGWYPDPWQEAGYRWWTGGAWSGEVTARTDDGSPLARQAAIEAATARAYGATPAYNPLGPPPDPPSPPARAAGIAVVVGAALTAIGSFMPWAEVRGSIFSTTIVGTDGDGVLTLFGGLVLAGLGVASRTPRLTRGTMIAALVVAFLVAFVALVDMADVNSRALRTGSGRTVIDASVGAGLWVVLLGAATSIAGCVHTLTTARRRTA